MITVLFWKLEYSLFIHRQSIQRMVNTLLMININLTCKRLLIFIWVGIAPAVSLCQSSELPQKHWYHNHNNRNWLKQPQSHFHQTTPHKSHHFWMVWYIFCTGYLKYFKFKQKILSVFPSFFWLWCQEIRWILSFL